MAEQLSEMTGMDLDTAQRYMEIAGGVEQAIELFFSGVSVDRGVVVHWPSYHRVLWTDTLHDSWKEQKIAFSDHVGERIGIVQPKNGPCGVLAVIQAMLIANRLSKYSCIDPNQSFTTTEIADVLVEIITVCSSHVAKVCTWETTLADETVYTQIVPLDKLGEMINDNLSQFVNPGGLILLMFSCIASKGEEQVRQEALKNGELPLLYGPFSLCTSELLMLMLTGVADGSVGAYDATGAKRQGDISVPSGVGLLSYSEFEAGIPVHDILKSPKKPVWILHSGDHFTVLFCNTNIESFHPPLQLSHYNGLPPGGPRCSVLELRGDQVIESASSVRKEVYIKPIPGEIDEIVQANPKDKELYPEDWTRWHYEAVLATFDGDIKGPERSLSENPAEIFEQGEPEIGAAWRCSSCYKKRFTTMCFGNNEAGAECCAHCNQPRETCGWTLWIPYSSLPTKWKDSMQRRHAPKIISILHTKWPASEIKLIRSSRDSNLLPSV